MGQFEISLKQCEVLNCNQKPRKRLRNKCDLENLKLRNIKQLSLFSNTLDIFDNFRLTKIEYSNERKTGHPIKLLLNQFENQISSCLIILLW